jgi:hypothetical protein
MTIMRLTHEINSMEVKSPSENALYGKVTNYQLLVSVHDIELQRTDQYGVVHEYTRTDGETYSFGLFDSIEEAESVILDDIGEYKAEIVQLFKDDIDAQIQSEKSSSYDSRSGAVERFIDSIHK